MSAFMVVSSVMSAVVGLFCLFMFVLCVAFKPRKAGPIFSFGTFVLVFFFLAFVSIPNSRIANFGIVTYKEVAPGVCIYRTIGGGKYLKHVPMERPITYVVSAQKNSVCELRWWRWVTIVYVQDRFDPRVSNREVIFYQTDKELALASGRIIWPPDDVSPITVNAGADVFWRHDHYGQPQPGFEMLATPKHGDARIEKWVFN